MTDETRKTLLVAYQERKQEEILHPFLDEKVTIGLLFHMQALLMARYLRGISTDIRRSSGSEGFVMLVLVSYDVATTDPGGRVGYTG